MFAYSVNQAQAGRESKASSSDEDERSTAVGSSPVQSRVHTQELHPDADADSLAVLSEAWLWLTMGAHDKENDSRGLPGVWLGLEPFPGDDRDETPPGSEEADAGVASFDDVLCHPCADAGSEEEEEEPQQEEERREQGAAEEVILAPPGLHQVDEEVARLPSMGSAGHFAGTCRPCGHIWKPAGCCKEIFCTYCHICRYPEWLAYKTAYKNAIKIEADSGATRSKANSRAHKASQRRKPANDEHRSWTRGREGPPGFGFGGHHPRHVVYSAPPGTFADGSTSFPVMLRF